MKVTIGHIGINLSGEEVPFPFWKDILAYLGFKLMLGGNYFDANDGHGVLCFSVTKPDYSEDPDRIKMEIAYGGR